MPARMDSARLQSNSTRIVHARDYEKVIHGPAVCEDCHCEVVGVHGGVRNVNGEQIQIDAFFRLPPHAESRGTGHTSNCHYNVGRIVERIVAQSREIKDLDEEADLLVAARKRRAEFRLHILMETLRWMSAKFTNANADSREQVEPPIGTRYVRSEEWLTPYLKTAKAMLSLVAAIQERPELASWIVLKYASHTLTWDEFFYDLEDYCGLFNYLSAHKDEYPRVRRPIAIAVEIIRTTKPKLTASGYWRVLGRASRCQWRGSGSIVAIRPVLYVADKELADQLSNVPFILACGLPRLHSFQSPSKSGLSPCADVALNIFDPAQVCRYRPMLKDEIP